MVSASFGHMQSSNIIVQLSNLRLFSLIPEALSRIVQLSNLIAQGLFAEPLSCLRCYGEPMTVESWLDVDFAPLNGLIRDPTTLAKNNLGGQKYGFI